MKTCILLFLLKYVLCGNVLADLAEYSIETSITYFNAGSELQAIKPEEISIIVYTKAHPEGTEIPLSDAGKISEVSPFDKNLKTIFYAHGWGDTVHQESTTLIRDALLKFADVNILVINWDKCAKKIYLVSKNCVPDVGKYIGQFVEVMSETYGYSKSNITVVGHSLGAHIGGHIGKYTNGTIGTIVGLDPAGPLYFKDQRNDRLTEDDAKYVLVMHTNAGMSGANYNLGHADYWPNNGFIQKGCGLNGQCSHIRAYMYYAESVTNNSFYARQCDSYKDFEAKKCSQNAKSLMAELNVNTAAFGNYYLDTNANAPYGLGDIV